MPRSLGPIPLGTPIVDAQGLITPFFRQRWQDVSDGWTQTGSTARGHWAAQTAQLAVNLLTVLTAGLYRVTWYLRITQVDAVSGSATVYLSFVDLDGTLLVYTGPTLANAINAWASAVVPVRCQASSNLQLLVTYASGTPGQMEFDAEAAVEFLP